MSTETMIGLDCSGRSMMVVKRRLRICQKLLVGVRKKEGFPEKRKGISIFRKNK